MNPIDPAPTPAPDPLPGPAPAITTVTPVSTPAAARSETPPATPSAPVVRIVGVGGAGLQAVARMAASRIGEAGFAVVHTDATLLENCTVGDRLLLGARVTHGLKISEPEAGRSLAEGEAHRLRHLCEGAGLVIVVAGMGGNTASGIAPVLARVARENGALVLALVTLPFSFEGQRRQAQARTALEQLRTAADAVITLPNEKVSGLLDDKTSLAEVLQIIDDLLADGVRGLLRLITRGGLLSVDFQDLCQVVRGRQVESCFATAEAAGENRAREVMERLLRHPLLDAGRSLAEADALLVSITGGPSLALRDVHQVMEQMRRAAERAEVVMGALVDPALGDRLAVTVVAARQRAAQTPAGASDAPRASTPAALPGDTAPPASEFPTRDVDDPLPALPPSSGGRPGQRYVPPAPSLSPEQAERLWQDQQPGRGGARRRRKPQARQGMLPLEVVSKGRFAKSEPTVHRGEDLDTPAYIRRGVPLN